MTDRDSQSDDPYEPPTKSDGFHEPTEETRRRNLITVAIIVGVLVLWIGLGLRNALF